MLSLMQTRLCVPQSEVAILAGERLKSDPSRGLSVEEVRSRFEQKRRERERERQAA
ncbi:hypothetical protein GCM10011359_27070 [Nesterenkonia alkaliphila]|nr:hypothetical protein GCM10011359_27070 [Nesterenkonia alkaliphila]